MRLYTIGEVVFRKKGQSYYQSGREVLGDIRVDMLRWFYKRDLPAEWEAVVLDPERTITPDDVNWATAGHRVTGDQS